MADNNKASGALSRRKLLALTLSGTAASFAGCSNGGNDNTTSESTATTSESRSTTVSSPSETTSTVGETNQDKAQRSSDQIAEPVVDMLMGSIPENINWNYLSSGFSLPFWPFDYTYVPLWNGTTNWWLIKDNGFNYDAKSKTATCQFRKEYGYWWNGNPVTAKDYWMQQEIERLEDPEGSVWEKWTLEDDHTLKGTRKKRRNPITVGNLSDRVLTYHKTWDKWLEQLQDASTKKEREKITNKLAKWKIPIKQFINDGLGNGVYKLVDWSTTMSTWKRFNKHPYSDQVPFETIRFHVGSGTGTKNQLISNDKIDFGRGKFPPELRGSTPNYVKTVNKWKTPQSRNLLFNYNDKHIGRRNVRRALMVILDFTKLKNFWNEKGGFVKQHQTGLPESLENKWLGEKLIDEMVDYPLKSDPDQAKKFMKRAGYSKEDNKWIDSDGDHLNITLLVPPFNQAELGKAMTQAWGSWGAKTDLLNPTGSKYVNGIFHQTGDWDIAIFQHGLANLDPVNFFATVGDGQAGPYHMRLGSSTDQVEQWLENGKTHSQLNGRPITITIPSSPKLEVEKNGGKEINIHELSEELKVTQSKKRSQEIIRILARYFNYDLPLFDMFPQTSAVWGDTENFKWPNKDANVWSQPANRAGFAAWRKGLIKPAQENK